MSRCTKLTQIYPHRLKAVTVAKGASTNTYFNRVNTCAINYVVFLGDTVEFSVSKRSN